MSREMVQMICANLEDGVFVRQDIGSPKDANLRDLWTHLRIKYRDGDSIVDEDGLIWDIFRKEKGFALYCRETEEAIEVPKPKKLGG